MKEIFKTLIEIPSVSTDVAANNQAIEYIDRFLSERGMRVRRHEFDGHPALVATTRHTTKPKLMLAAHVDVVPAPPAAFRFVEKDGRLFGRGAYDMKCTIAAYLQIVDDLQDELSEYDFGIMITSDEELGGLSVEKLLTIYDAQACVLLDGGEGWKLEEAAKAWTWFKLTAAGVAGHASRPWNGVNAADKIMTTVQAIQRNLFSAQSFETNTCNVGYIRADGAYNQISDYCEAGIDVRSINQHEETRLRHEIDRICTEHGVAMEVFASGKAFSVDLGDPHIVAWGNSFEKVMRQPLQTMRSLGSSDARYFSAKGIPTVVTYPVGEGFHSDNEWVDEKAFYQLRELLSDYVKTIARSDAVAVP